ncbi:MAG TPA: nucleotidyltransferase domain-containing protein [Dictyoglomaceae bacterium]|nr:nucleotidyltransferase domain-containing protein [Dictyoglomaceae bacterium]HPU43641.1 nucleotidyltransferase domain-containing protein [Dictyoglomaceae bacterium]
MGIKEKYKDLPPLPPDTKERVKNLKGIFDKNRVLLAYIFGSFEEKENPEDIDIAVLLEGDYFELLKSLKSYLSTERIDLLDLSAVSPFSALHILRTGKLIYSKSTKIENSYEMKILRECCDLEVLRKKEIEMIKKGFL